jgi:hypothetical protein
MPNDQTQTIKAAHEVLAEFDFAPVRLNRGYANRALRIDLTLLPCGGNRLEKLDLEIPLRGRVARMVHGINGRFRDAVEFRNLPARQGVVWSAADIPPTGWEENFCSYVFLGNPSRGLCWFTANSLGWSRDPNTPALDVVRRGDRVTLRVHLVNVPLEIEAPRRITFFTRPVMCRQPPSSRNPRSAVSKKPSASSTCSFRRSRVR